ncbi:MAG: chorismate synthase [Thermoprotei archaeon]|nr:chorismate synthase [Thermoprotei archaeon]
MSSSLGKMFRVTIFGESHGPCIGVVIDGCPAGLMIDEGGIREELRRRSPREPEISTSRREPDEVKILSGVFRGYTTGAPLCMLVRNEDVRSHNYHEVRYRPRPGHADYTAYVKYGGYNDYRGGGIFSGRITVAMVMAGAIARKILAHFGIKIIAHTIEIGGIKARRPSMELIEELASRSPVGCADLKASAEMVKVIKEARRLGDSVGGVIEVIALNVPPGVGEPVFDTLEGDLAKAFFAIPGVKGVEFGAGFKAASMKGSEYNDQFIIRHGRIATKSNNAGGIQGGISNGMPIICRIAFRPPSSIRRPQRTVDLRTLKETVLRLQGRFDPCIVPRALPIVKAMMAIVLTDHMIQAGMIPRVIKE